MSYFAFLKPKLLEFLLRLPCGWFPPLTNSLTCSLQLPPPPHPRLLPPKLLPPPLPNLCLPNKDPFKKVTTDPIQQ